MFKSINATKLVAGENYIARIWTKPEYTMIPAKFIDRTSMAQLKEGVANYIVMLDGARAILRPSDNGLFLVVNFNGKDVRITFGTDDEAQTEQVVEVIAEAVEAVEESKEDRKRRLDRDRKRAKRAADRALAEAAA